MLRSLTDDVVVDVVTTAEQRRAAGALRYRVYCEERRWEPASRFPDGVERDRFDDRAVHLMARVRSSGEAIGCVRVILADSAAPAEPFPFEDVAGLRLWPSGRVSGADRVSLGEVSRFAVSTGSGASRARVGVSLELAAAATAVVLEYPLGRVFVVTTPVTRRLLRVMGFSSHCVSDHLVHHGGRRVFEMMPTELLSAPPARPATGPMPIAGV